jgi:hypothetical protein
MLGHATGRPHQDGTTVQARLAGTAIERKRFLRRHVYQNFPLFVRPFLFWFYSYVLRLGFADGVEGLIFHTLQRFWFRFLIDARLWELQRGRVPVVGERSPAITRHDVAPNTTPHN